MTIERTAACLGELLEAYIETRDKEMTEVPMLAITTETAQAIQKALYTVEGLRILKGAYAEERT